jgi:hypothetical protein
MVHTHLKANLTNSFIDLLVKVGGVVDEKGLSLDDAGDGGGSQADGAEDASELVEVSGIGARLDELASEDADEGNLFSETLDAGLFNTGEVTLVDAASVEAVLEGIGVAELAAAAARGKGGGVGHGCVGKRVVKDGWCAKPVPGRMLRVVGNHSMVFRSKPDRIRMRLCKNL